MPGCRYQCTEKTSSSPTIVRRGLDETALDSYRVAESIAWRRWTQDCFDLTSDLSDLERPDEFAELLISFISMQVKDYRSLPV